MLESDTIIYFLLGGISDVGPVQMLSNHGLCFIHSWIKEIRMVLMQYIILDF